MGLGAMVWVSSRVSTFQEAYQLGGMVVLPVILLLFGQLGGVVYFSPIVVLIVGAVLWLLTLVLIWYGARSFKRGELIARVLGYGGALVGGSCVDVQTPHEGDSNR